MDFAEGTLMHVKFKLSYFILNQRINEERKYLIIRFFEKSIFVKGTFSLF